jgi:4-hydroxy-2-oxoheptanedioate aldolase
MDAQDVGPPERPLLSESGSPFTLIERQRLRMLAHLRRKVSLGVYLNFMSSDLVEFLGVLGFQWLFLDGERTAVTPSNCRDVVRAADLAGMFCMARIASANITEIEGYLDAGVLGILAPRISNAKQAEELVAAVKFPTVGRRRAGRFSRCSGFGVVDQGGLANPPGAAHARDSWTANTATFTAAMLETQEGIEQLDEILAVPGLDYVALGPNDLALSLGCDSAEHPRVKTLLDSARRRLQRTGRPRIALVTDNAGATAEAAQGATLIAIADATLLAEAGARFLSAASGLRPPP